MKRKTMAVLALLLLAHGPSFSQGVAINTDSSSADGSAMLEVKSTSKGLLIPRVSLSSLSDATTITSPATSLLVYNTNAALSGGAGFFYNSGSPAAPAWSKLLVSGSGNGLLWGLSGNASVSGSQFLGTTDASDLIIKTNGTQRAAITSAGVTTIGDGTNQSKFDADGSLSFSGTATVFDDMLFPLLNVQSNGINFSSSEIAMSFPRGDTTREAYIVAQLPHGWLEGSTIYPHVHWKQTSSNATTWSISYKWFNIGDPIPASFTNLSTSSMVKTYSGGSMQQISDFPAISGTGKLISSLLLIRLYRNDNNAPDTQYAYQFDIHIEKDAVGSHTQYVK